MGAVRLTLRAELRRRGRPMLMLALLLAITGGVVLTAAAGAARTDTAYPRLLRWANAAQVNVIVKHAPVPAFFAALRRLPQVTAVSAQGLFNFTLPARHGPPAELVATFSSPDDSMGRTADRLKLLDGQLPDPARRGTAVIDQDLAARERLRPGGTLHLLMIPNTKGGIPDLGRARPVSFRVTGIAVFDSQIVPATKANTEPTVLRAGCPPGSCVVLSDQRPEDIRNYSKVRDTPLVLGGVLALLAVGTLAPVLVTGVPLGLLAGRWAWVLFASSAGLAPAASIPAVLVLLIVPVTVALAALIAAWPGRAAAGIGPATVLRAE